MKLALIIFCNFISFKKGINANLYYMQKSKITGQRINLTIIQLKVECPGIIFLYYNRKYDSPNSKVREKIFQQIHSHS